jgi:hypothetical protein
MNESESESEEEEEEDVLQTLDSKPEIASEGGAKSLHLLARDIYASLAQPCNNPRQ